MSKKIPLTQGKFAIVDNEDYEWLNQHKWCVQKAPHTYYAVRGIGRKGKSKLIWMHREILSTPNDLETDHRNHKGWDNRKSNLRICTHIENQHNRCNQYNSTSGFKGVSWHKASLKWQARIICKGKRLWLGLFNNKIEEVMVYDKKAKELFGEFAKLNLTGE